MVDVSVRGMVLYLHASTVVRYIEMCNDLSKNAVINCLRAVTALGGPIFQIRCDRGTNLVGASNELTSNLEHMYDGAIKQYLQTMGCEFIFNLGGVREHQIRSARAVLDYMLLNSTTLDSGSYTILETQIRVI